MSRNFTPRATSSLMVWLDYLTNIHSTTIDLGLERVSSVAKESNLIKPAQTVITVGGTNGKGLTCAFIETVLLDAGYSVGVYSSPHLIHYNERVRINGKNLTDTKYVQAFNFIEKQRSGVSLSFFEYSTLAALYSFKNENVDVILLEVGLGGRLDATNVVEHDVSIIVSLGIDHVDWLSKDINVIGFEKAGIFRAGKPAICGEPRAPWTVSSYANKIGANYYQIEIEYEYKFTKNLTWQWKSGSVTMDDLPIPRLPLQNAATAIMALNCSEIDISKNNIINALYSVSLPGRIQLLSSDPTILLDVAHNPHSARYLVKHIRQYYTGLKFHVVIGMLNDKDIKTTIDVLSPISSKWYPTSLSVPRGAHADELCEYLVHFEGKYSSSVEALKAALLAKDKDAVLVVGSFHTVAQVLKYWKRKGERDG
ncbi:bifunctional protein folC [Candidatus Photodesmus blepharus]|uniref:Dihydrofolate synthase/folylpolyglutamate synthase n=1 Tax=Candidatus Photodesmus blepharonis TaxID=1179155 RepID=A0A084CNC4_9GAMM|nr:bifunctional tetrahydrofolate synthase/dihydrofolate synthase [Candidatus Photodesmus blepharus]KEY91303.1 bifunctional protein folC [Candidatus Photodesmus blepharus]